MLEYLVGGIISFTGFASDTKKNSLKHISYIGRSRVHREKPNLLFIQAATFANSVICRPRLSYVSRVCFSWGGGYRFVIPLKASKTYRDLVFPIVPVE